MITRLGVALLLGMTLPISMTARALTLESPVEQVQLVELFTSHGCSSCPPADRWLGKLESHPGLWQKLIPMAFHVDYWDYLGWQDRFASPAYSQRQRQYRQSGAIRSVYTPGFVVNGKEWRGWFRHPKLELGEAKKVGRLTLDVQPGVAVKAEFSPQAGIDQQGLEANLVILGFDLQSEIGAGENRGRTLSEHFVVLSHGRSRVQTHAGQWSLPWPEFSRSGSKRLAVVLWLSHPESGEPVQAVGGWLPG
ncbi:MAG: DUF1223 domain-containing protein [Candidatus Thiodiazotropha lotti]|uniref:DUF1223 domain-containing protein n=1 Tax=Candidatus Thiodiazotropha endoloripes TaxID=1818881 RepID=A0A1E2UH35_9GAMM|nr:DUF1223 domain-containing protein [Candidatus Thiodiazotropha endoloripes]MCG7900300.1 DUF1223 domain-containing protein [Candidatus Thiodiazotropha weberae]MCG7993133.1 DUF1223 domain-containing protein [Candidatus Thiodiazotropha lotti]MCG7903934.1 DUF1223 domain-containing protein [Candidatus Thiodiazotropha weberae]MCG7915429.1 DUF1223 domain-containing protein [Candidatus Thiodiazotropha weberae]MCG8000739.1 DUF1223 domain-containing protein [Candidatus Thiodiazotropha lotti]